MIQKCDNCPYKDTQSDCQMKCEAKLVRKNTKVDLHLKPLYKIPKVSEKRKIEDLKYQVLRTKFLSKPENQICPVTKEQTTQIHHMKKRRGFADDWARENNISLYLDTRFWLAVSHTGHQWIESSPEEAYKLGYSIKNNSSGN